MTMLYYEDIVTSALVNVVFVSSLFLLSSSRAFGLEMVARLRYTENLVVVEA